LHEFEKTGFFEACLPVEELARRGRDTLRFGPMKPVGLTDPRTGREPYAAVQLRRERLLNDACNLVGFQNHLRFGEQKRVLRLIPGLEKAEFIRYGQMHRNTFLNAPCLLAENLAMKADPGIFIAGQLCGLEGYIEAIASGLMAAVQLFRHVHGKPPVQFPRSSALGGLQRYLSESDPTRYQPANITFSLLPPLPREMKRRIPRKKDRNAWRVRQSLEQFQEFLQQQDWTIPPGTF
jgi:methylenetetrahydrofolate--tRNA-(uracil-5-)-methyltransferase